MKNDHDLSVGRRRAVVAKRTVVRVESAAASLGESLSRFAGFVYAGLIVWLMAITLTSTDFRRVAGSWYAICAVTATAVAALTGWTNLDLSYYRSSGIRVGEEAHYPACRRRHGPRSRTSAGAASIPARSKVPSLFTHTNS